MTLDILAIDPGQFHSGVLTLSDGVVREVSHEYDNRALVRAIVNRNVKVVIEDFTPQGQMTGHSVVDTCKWVGRFQQHFLDAGYDTTVMLRAEVLDLLVPGLHQIESEWRAEKKAAQSRGEKPPAKPNRDKHLWHAILEMHGGESAAKKGGPLYGVKSHARSALALALALRMQQAQGQPATSQTPGQGRA